ATIGRGGRHFSETVPIMDRKAEDRNEKGDIRLPAPETKSRSSGKAPGGLPEARPEASAAHGCALRRLKAALPEGRGRWHALWPAGPQFDEGRAAALLTRRGLTDWWAARSGAAPGRCRRLRRRSLPVPAPAAGRPPRGRPPTPGSASSRRLPPARVTASPR